MTSSVPARIGVVADYNLLKRLEPAGPGEIYRARDAKRGPHPGPQVAPVRLRVRRRGPTVAVYTLMP